MSTHFGNELGIFDLRLRVFDRHLHNGSDQATPAGRPEKLPEEKFALVTFGCLPYVRVRITYVISRFRVRIFLRLFHAAP